MLYFSTENETGLSLDGKRNTSLRLVVIHKNTVTLVYTVKSQLRI